MTRCGAWWRGLRTAAAACAAAGALAGGACAGGDQRRPGWVDRPIGVAEEGGRITGVGVGRSRTEAEQAAFARLAQRLEAGVMARETLDRRETSGAGAEPSATRFDRFVDLRTDVTLYSARIEATHQDRREGTHFALASLDRRAAAGAHRARAEETATGALGALARADAAGTALRRRAALLDARDLARESLAHARAAVVVAPTGEADGALMRRALDLATEAAAELVGAGGPPALAVQGGADVSAGMVDAVRAAVLDIGGVIATDGAGTVRVMFAQHPAASHDPGQAVARWRVSLWLVDRGDGSTLGELVRTGVVSAPSESEAARQAVRAGERALALEAPPFLRSLLRETAGGGIRPAAAP